MDDSDGERPNNSSATASAPLAHTPPFSILRHKSSPSPSSRANRHSLRFTEHPSLLPPSASSSRPSRPSRSSIATATPAPTTFNNSIPSQQRTTCVKTRVSTPITPRLDTSSAPAPGCTPGCTPGSAPGSAPASNCTTNTKNNNTNLNCNTTSPNRLPSVHQLPDTTNLNLNLNMDALDSAATAVAPIPETYSTPSYHLYPKSSKSTLYRSRKYHQTQKQQINLLSSSLSSSAAMRKNNQSLTSCDSNNHRSSSDRRRTKQPQPQPHPQDSRTRKRTQTNHKYSNIHNHGHGQVKNTSDNMNHSSSLNYQKTRSNPSKSYTGTITTQQQDIDSDTMNRSNGHRMIERKQQQRKQHDHSTIRLTSSISSSSTNTTTANNNNNLNMNQNYTLCSSTSTPVISNNTGNLILLNSSNDNNTHHAHTSNYTSSSDNITTIPTFNTSPTSTSTSQFTSRHRNQSLTHTPTRSTRRWAQDRHQNPPSPLASYNVQREEELDVIFSIFQSCTQAVYDFFRKTIPTFIASIPRFAISIIQNLIPNANIDHPPSTRSITSPQQQPHEIHHL